MYVINCHGYFSHDFVESLNLDIDKNQRGYVDSKDILWEISHVISCYKHVIYFTNNANGLDHFVQKPDFMYGRYDETKVCKLKS